MYEFHCADCDKSSELLARSSDWSDEKCPHCGSAQLVKQLSTFAPALPAAPMFQKSQCLTNVRENCKKRRRIF
ncbi:MAG: FmdB family zinc ribbon protein [Limisphaerales bacterium]